MNEIIALQDNLNSWHISPEINGIAFYVFSDAYSGLVFSHIHCICKKQRVTGLVSFSIKLRFIV